MDVNMTLSMEEVGIIQNLINFMDAQNVGADELLDCDYDTYNALSDKFERVMEDA